MVHCVAVLTRREEMTRDAGGLSRHAIGAGAGRNCRPLKAFARAVAMVLVPILEQQARLVSGRSRS